MKITKNFFICALLVLMLLLCVNACSAEETLDETLGTDAIDEAIASDALNDELSESTDTFVADANGGGDYTKISSAAGNASGGEKILVNNGNDEFALDVDADSLKQSLTLPEGTIYVSESGSDENDGLSEENAIATLSHAVDIVKARENKTATIYVLNGDYTTDAIDIGDDVAASLSIIGQEKENVIIHGTGSYIFDIYGDNLEWNFKNLDFDGLDSTARTSAALVLYSKNGNFTVDDCNFRNINSKLGAIAIGNDNGNTNVTNCIIEDITGSTSSTSVLTVNGDGKFILDNIEIRNCRLVETVASSTVSSYLRSIIYVNTYEADVTLSNSRITDNRGPMMSLMESRSKLTITNTSIVNNVVNTSINGANGGDALIWASNDNSNINIAQCVITDNTIVKSGKGLFYNQRGSTNVEYSDISRNVVESFVGSTGTITADNNWWATNDQPNAKINKWVIMNVETDDSNLSENNKITLTIDFNHVKTASGNIEELTGGEIPKKSYNIAVSAQDGEITPTRFTVNKGEVKSQTFTVTEVNDVITVNCDGDIVEVTIEGASSYKGIIYVNKTGDNRNEGSIDAPVADLTKAIELACAGSGQIIIDEGTYAGCGYQITGDLNITGVGEVILDAEGQGGLFATGYPSGASQIILNNLILTGADADFGQAIYSYANELILNDIIIADNPGSGSLIIQSGKLSMNNCVIANHNGGNVISDSSSAQILINNTIFENNTVTDYAICYMSGYSGNLIIENSQFIDNTGKLGIIKTNKKVTVKDSCFINNTNTNSYGGAICDFDSLTLTNSTFINNRAARYGGAISVGYNRVATITKSTFINNTANTENGKFYGDAIYNYGKLTLNYCVLLTNAENSLVYSESEYDANAQYNWWGTNDDPSYLNGVGTYEDDWYDEVDCVIDSSKWVCMDVTTNLTENNISVGDKLGISVLFTKYMDSTGNLNDMADSIPEVDVYASAVNGALDIQEQSTSDNIAFFTYTAENAGEDTITFTSSKATVPITFNVNEAIEDIIYVDSTNGLDTNDGKTPETAVKTIEKAVEIANEKIVILTGEYTVTSLLNITKDLKIVGEGEVTVKSNAVTTISYEEWDDWEEDWVTTTETHYYLIENNANLRLENIRFTLVSASISDPLILNNANLYVNTCEFNSIKVTSSKGVIQNTKNAKLEVNGTGFTSSSSTYGAINNNGELLVNNSGFTDTDRSSEGGVYSTAITSYNQATVLNTVFKNNKGSAGGAVYVMYSYTLKENPVMVIDNCTFVGNSASGSYGDGAAVKCSGNQVTLTISNSTFDKNTAARNGGAIYAQGTVNITQCVFTENSAGDANAIYAYGGTVDVTNSIILEDGNAIARYESSYSNPATVTANNNWWGTNDQPANVGEGITVNTWVKMDAEFIPKTAQSGDEVTVTATFDNDKLPEGIITVNFISSSGNLNEIVTVQNAQASVTYTLDENDNNITAVSDNAVIVMPIEKPEIGTVYVSMSGNDENDGSSPSNAVATISHAIELANESIGKIIILNGNYALTETLSITKDLDIKGQGTVTINGNQNKFLTSTANLNLTNLEFTNGYSTSDKLIEVSGTGVSLTMDNVKFYSNAGKNGIAVTAANRVIINNSIFHDNNLISANANALGVLYFASVDAVVENTVFENNRAQKGGAIYTSRASTATTGSLEIINCTFENNTAVKGTGGAIFVSSNNNAVNISNSRFINNTAIKGSAGGDGAAIIMTTGLPQVTISQSVFVDNSALNDAGICVNKGNLDITDSIILAREGDENYTINVVDGTLSAEDNWWGNNENASTNAEVSKIVKMNATYTPQNPQPGDEITITVTFDNDNLPKDVINVALTSSSGKLDEIITINDSETSLNYTVDANDRYVSVSSSDAEIILEFDMDAGKIFVLPGASDSNPGTRDAPVGTIAHALEIANGQIVLLEGTHKTDDLGSIYYDLNITGEGNVIIDAQNNNRILYVGSEGSVIITNVVMVNGYTAEDSGALLGNANQLTLINCTLANSSTGPMSNGGAIYSVGKLTLINTTIANCSAREGGAIFSNDVLASGNSINLINSKFINNKASGNDNLGGGAIFAQQIAEFTIENTSFVENKALDTSSGGAIFISHSEANIEISGSEFINNHAAGKDNTGGGAIYFAGISNYERSGSMTITGTLFENNTCDNNGGAIYARATTVNVANSVLINNDDMNGLAVYGYKTSVVSPSITLNDNWWGSNDSPKDLAGGNSNYKPTLNRWAILTATNDSAIVSGNDVKLTASINRYTTGSSEGTLSSPITVPREVTIITTFADIKGVLENGIFEYDLTVQQGMKYVAVNVDNETIVLYVNSSDVTVGINDINAKKYDKVNVVVNVTSMGSLKVNSGNVELYVDDNLIAIIPVIDGKASQEVVISNDENTYELIAKFVDESGLFNTNQSSATLTVSGICELVNETFFNFFDSDGILREEIVEDELVFHGDFSDLGVNTITIDRPIAISGDNAVLYDMAYYLKSDDIIIRDVSLIADGADFANSNHAAIYTTGNGIEINKVIVNYTAPSNKDAFGIYIKAAQGFNLIGSEIYFDANNKAGLIHQAAIIIDQSYDGEIEGNLINASLPARNVAYNYYYPELYGIFQDLVLGIGIQGGENINFEDNVVIIDAKTAEGTYATLDSFMADSVTNLVIAGNSFTQTDFTGVGKAGYANVVDLYSFNGVTVENNNILVNTTTGEDGAGTAYPIQATGPYNNLLITKNNLTAISKGPALGIYSQNYDGITDVEISFNNINVTGYASYDEYALVSGMELQDTYAKVYNNIIYSQSISAYNPINKLFGISYAQYTTGTHYYDIKNNTIFTEGKETIFLLKAIDSNVTDNILYAHELYGDESVNISSGEGNTVKDNYPVETELNVTVNNATGLANASIIVTSNAEGNVTVKVGEDYIFENVPIGSEFVLPELPAGIYSVVVNYTGTLRYLAAVNDTEKLEISKSSPDIGIVAEPITYGEVLVVNVTSNVDGDYTITVNNESKAISLVDGIGSAEFSGLAAGTYEVVVSFAGDGSYNNASVNVTVVVGKATPEITVSADDIVYGDVLAVNVTGSVDGNYTVTVNDESQTVNVVDGAGSVEFAGLSAGTYDVVVAFAGDDNYNNVSANVAVVVGKATPEITVSADDITYGDVLAVNVTGSVDGNYTVTVNDESQTVNVVDGAGSVEFTGLVAGTYDVVVAFAGDDNYNNDSADATVEVTKATPEIIVAADNIVYGDDLIVIVEMSTDVVRRPTVTIGNESKLVTMRNGVGVVKFSGLAAGTYDVFVSYKGDANYAKTTVNTTAKVTRATPEIIVTADNINYGDDLVVNVELPSDVARRAIVTVGNESKFVSLVDGVGSVKFSGLTVGNHTISVSYNGDSNYGKASVNATVKVNRGPAEISVVANPVSYGEDVVIDVQLPNDVTRRASVTIGNETKMVSLVNGSASVKFSGLAAGTHDVTVLYNGDANYIKSSLNAIVKVNRATPDIQITAEDINYGETLTVGVQLPSDVSRRAVVTVDNVTKYASLKDGIGAVKFTDLSEGAHEVVVSYEGDPNYAKASSTTTITVNS